MQEYDFFNWNDFNEFMSEDEFLEYKAWYFTFYDELNEKGDMDAAPDEDIEKEYEAFEKEAFDTRVNEFSEKHELTAEFVRSALNKYFADKQRITKLTLRYLLADMELPLIK